ncbi:MAG: ABC transporter permease [Clostridia bacterium]|nr:ABC transporter permease [Clostridia bacterium]
MLLTGLLMLVSGLAGLSAFIAADDLTVPASVALVDEENSLISRLCIGMVENTDYARELLVIEKCSRDKAMEGLEKGSFAAAIILPEDYTSRIMVGESCKGTIILSEKALTMKELVQRASEIGEQLIAAGQYGVFAGEDLIRSGQSLTQGDYEKYLTLSNAGLIDKALDMEDGAFETVILPYSAFGTDTVSHFILSWACFFASLCGLFFTDLYTADRGEAIRDRLKSCGVGTVSFVLGKVLWPFVFRCLLWIAVIAAAGRYTALDLSFGNVLWSLTGLLLCTCFTTGLALGFPGGAAWTVLLLSVVGLFFCGAIIPLQYLPYGFFTVGKLLPLGAFAGTVSSVFGGQGSTSSLIICAVWAAASMILAFAQLSKREGRPSEI